MDNITKVLSNGVSGISNKSIISLYDVFFPEGYNEDTLRYILPLILQRDLRRYIETVEFRNMETSASNNRIPKSRLLDLCKVYKDLKGIDITEVSSSIEPKDTADSLVTITIESPEPLSCIGAYLALLVLALRGK